MERFSTKGESLLVYEPALAPRNKRYKPSDRSELAFDAQASELMSQSRLACDRIIKDFHFYGCVAQVVRALR